MAPANLSKSSGKASCSGKYQVRELAFTEGTPLALLQIAW